MRPLAACIACFSLRTPSSSTKETLGRNWKDVTSAAAEAEKRKDQDATGHLPLGNPLPREELSCRDTCCSRLTAEASPSRAELLVSDGSCLRDAMVLANSPTIVTVINRDGRIMYQNPQSRAYFGERSTVEVAHSEDILALLFTFEPAKRLQMLEELEQLGIDGIWKSVVRVPHTLDDTAGSRDSNSSVTAAQNDHKNRSREAVCNASDLLGAKQSERAVCTGGSDLRVAGGPAVAVPTPSPSDPVADESPGRSTCPAQPSLRAMDAVVGTFTLTGQRHATTPEPGPCGKHDGSARAPSRDTGSAVITESRLHKRCDGAVARLSAGRQVIRRLYRSFTPPTFSSSASAAAPGAARCDMKAPPNGQARHHESGWFRDHAGRCGFSAVDCSRTTPARSACSSTSIALNPLATSTFATLTMDAWTTAVTHGSPVASASNAVSGIEAASTGNLNTFNRRPPRRAASCRASCEQMQGDLAPTVTVDATGDGRNSPSRRTASRTGSRAVAFALSLSTSPLTLVTTPQLPPAQTSVTPSSPRTALSATQTDSVSIAAPARNSFASRGQRMAAEVSDATAMLVSWSSAPAVAATAVAAASLRFRSSSRPHLGAPVASSARAPSAASEQNLASSGSFHAARRPTDREGLGMAAASKDVALPEIVTGSRSVDAHPVAAPRAPALRTRALQRALDGGMITTMEDGTLAAVKGARCNHVSSAPEDPVQNSGAARLLTGLEEVCGLGRDDTAPQEAPSEPECWHEVWAKAARDPVTGADVIVLTQMDVTAKVVAERHLALVMETEHRLVEQLFPRHILQYITEEWASREAATMTQGQARGRGGNREGDDKACGGGNQHWRLVVRDCNALATWHPEVTLLFADIRGFTPMCKEVEPQQVMMLLNSLYSRYDGMLDKYGVYKVETIGDCYFVAGGLIHEDEDGMAVVRDPDSDEDPLHAERVFMFAKAMLSAAREVVMPTTGQPVEIRIGLHTGPVVSGVVGTRMPRFCVFGDTVNTASRMESTGLPGAIHASKDTFSRLRRSDGWEPTGGIEVKGKGLMSTYLWRPAFDGLSVCGDGSNQSTNPGQHADPPA